MDRFVKRPSNSSRAQPEIVPSETATASCLPTASSSKTSQPQDPPVADAPTVSSSTADSTTKAHRPNPNTGGKPNRYHLSWRTEFPWHTHDPATGKIACTLCKSCGVSSDFVSGKPEPANGWKREYLLRHNTLHSKRKIVDIPKAQNRFKETVAVSQEKASRPHMGLMRDVLFTVQAERPISFASSVHDLVTCQITKAAESVNVPIPNLPSDHRSNYSNYRFIEALNEVTKQHASTELESCRFFGLHVDESTDISSCKCLLLYTQHFSRETRQNVMKFRAAIEVSSTTSAALLDAVVSYFDSIGLNPSGKLVYFTSDGASNMLGCRNGLAERLKRHYENDYMVQFHCCCHKEALAVKDSYLSMPFFEDLDDDVRSVVAYINSHNCHRELSDICRFLDQPKYKKLTRLYDIRWLSRADVMSALASSLPSLQHYFASKSGSGSNPTVTAGQLSSLCPFRSAPCRYPPRPGRPLQSDADGRVSPLRLGGESYCKNSFPPSLLHGTRNRSGKVRTHHRCHGNPGINTHRADAARGDSIHQQTISNLEARLLTDEQVTADAKVFLPGPAAENARGPDFATYRVSQIERLGAHYRSLGIDAVDLVQEWQQFKISFKVGTFLGKTWKDVLVKAALDPRVRKPQLAC